MPASKIAAVACSLLLTAGLGACGGGDGGDGGDSGGGDGGSGETVAAGAFVSDVCTAVNDWISGIQERSAAIANSFQSGDPEESKGALSDLFGQMSAQTEELVTAVEKAGVPDVDDGEQIADDLSSVFSQTADLFAQTQEDIEALPTDPQGFQKGAAEIGPTLQEAITNITSSVSDTDNAELQEAFEKEESCSAAPM